MTSKEQAKRRFEEVFTSIVDEVTDFVAQTKISEDAVKWYRENLIYNTFGGKLNRGLSVIDTYSILTGKTELSDEEYRRVAVLGWCIELVSAHTTAALLIRRAVT
jgi:farnesyl diphosphate synthase